MTTDAISIAPKPQNLAILSVMSLIIALSAIVVQNVALRNLSAFRDAVSKCLAIHEARLKIIEDRFGIKPETPWERIVK